MKVPASKISFEIPYADDENEIQYAIDFKADHKTPTQGVLTFREGSDWVNFPIEHINWIQEVLTGITENALYDEIK